MIQDSIVITSTDGINDRDQLERILKTVFETAENIVTHERKQRTNHDLGEQADLSPLFGVEDSGEFTLADLEETLSSLTVEDEWYYEDWKPGELCPNCGGEKISAIQPREIYCTYDSNGENHDFSPGEANGPHINHWCRECSTQLSGHPALALFWIE